MIKFTEDHEAMIQNTARRVDKLEGDSVGKEARLLMLEAFKVECINHHAENDAKHKRLEDPVNRNTESNLLLAEAIVDMNITITKLVQNDDEAKPAVKFYKDIGTVWSFNKMLWAAVVSLAVGVAAIAGAWKVLG